MAAGQRRQCYGRAEEQPVRNTAPTANSARTGTSNYTSCYSTTIHQLLLQFPATQPNLTDVLERLHKRLGICLIKESRYSEHRNRR